LNRGVLFVRIYVGIVRDGTKLKLGGYHPGRGPPTPTPQKTWLATFFYI